MKRNDEGLFPALEEELKNATEPLTCVLGHKNAATTAEYDDMRGGWQDVVAR